MTGGQFLDHRCAPTRSSSAKNSPRSSACSAEPPSSSCRRKCCRSRAPLRSTTGCSTRQLLKKASDLDLLRLEIPDAHGGLGLDLISAAYDRRADRDQPVVWRIARRAHRRSARCRCVYFGSAALRRHAISPRLASGELIGAYALTEPQSGIRRAGGHAPPPTLTDGRPALSAQRPEDVDHERRVRRPVHDLRQGRRRSVHRASSSSARMGVVSGRDEIKLGLDGSSTTALMLDNVKVPVENVLGTIGAGSQGRVQRAQLRPGEARRPQHVGRPAGAQPRRDIREGTAAVRPRDRRVRLDQAEARRHDGARASSATPCPTARSATSIARSTRAIAPTAARDEDDRRLLASSARSTRSGRARRSPGRSTRRCRCTAATATRASSRPSAPYRDAPHHPHLRGHQRDQPVAGADAAAEAVARVSSARDAVRNALLRCRPVARRPRPASPERARFRRARQAGSRSGCWRRPRRPTAPVSKEAQEIRRRSREIVIEAYATESGVARAREDGVARRQPCARWPEMWSASTRSDAADKVAAAAKLITAAFEARAAWTARSPQPRNASPGTPRIDVIAARRRDRRRRDRNRPSDIF